MIYLLISYIVGGSILGMAFYRSKKLEIVDISLFIMSPLILPIILIVVIMLMVNKKYV